MAVITILGAGVMGSAMCLPARARGHEVRLVGTHLDRAIIDSIKVSGHHPKLAVTLPAGVKAFAHNEFGQALGNDSDVILLGVSSAGIGWAIDQLCDSLDSPKTILMITKGLAAMPEMLMTLPDYVRSEVSRRTGLEFDIAAVGGPCIAGELAVGRQTGVVITSHNLDLARKLCAMFATDFYHPRRSSDVIGVEVCAAFKNFYAIAVGWAAGRLEKLDRAQNEAFNYNAGAILFDQAIAEMMILVRHFGGEDRSVWAMPGAGDLYVTCQAGRNSRLGHHLGLGLTYSEVKAGPMKDDTIEGAELGLTVASTLDTLMESGRLDAASLPLTRALLSALTRDIPLEIPWNNLHRYH